MTDTIIWSYHQGDCIPVIIEPRDENDPFDLTGYSVEVELTWPPFGKCDRASLKGDDLTIDLVAGKITGEFSGSVTAKIPVGTNNPVNLVLTEPDGCRGTVPLGRLQVKP